MMPTRLSLRLTGEIIIILFWMLTLAVNAPGHLSLNFVAQLQEGRSLTFGGYHPPFMSLLLGAFDRVLPGSALFMAFMQGLFFGSLLLLITHSEKITGWTLLVLLMGFLTPLILVYQGIVWKDVLFANFAIFTFVVIAVASKYKGLRRHILYALAIIVSCFAALTRQNGFVIVLFATISIVWLNMIGHSVLFKMTIGLLASVLIYLTIGTTTNYFIRFIAKKPPGGLLESGFYVVSKYDISGILARNDAVDVDFLRDRGLDMDSARADAKFYYRPDHLDSITDATRFAAEFNKLTVPELQKRLGPARYREFWDILGPQIRRFPLDVVAY